MCKNCVNSETLLADPEDILRKQQEIRLKMQGGRSQREEYSTYEQDKAELEARHKRVDVSTSSKASFLIHLTVCHWQELGPSRCLLLLAHFYKLKIQTLME